MNLVEYPDAELMMFTLADQLASDLGTQLRTHDRASLSVPGGTTPGPVFDVLSGVGLDWDRVTVFPNDERWVPETSERSNGRLLKQRLLTGKAAAATFLPLYAGAERPEDAIDALAEAIEPHLPISVLLLGMGADMHTASLFPGADRLAEALAPDAPVLLPMRAAGAGEPRVTLSARVLRDAMAIHVLITGAEKRAALERAMDLTPDQAPIRAVLDEATVHWAA
ncbi:6-phosphogluconolactonase [Defluviimonas denitrificans]|jgi:6-phosphogluconolactonase|uniref:6-phosphogluconolactonase n=1 Tax=Albidovulum denitrificans TaxID=404881 RepID=A0A2S8SCQ6_9RHOB|nr:6-phosphogluconolactonase [Defluviimonas denitrificans]PQV58560.1 6-phosphogluconolactonase [Defluviimonas denitrificans]